MRRSLLPQITNFSSTFFLWLYASSCCKLWWLFTCLLKAFYCSIQFGWIENDFFLSFFLEKRIECELNISKRARFHRSWCMFLNENGNIMEMTDSLCVCVRACVCINWRQIINFPLIYYAYWLAGYVWSLVVLSCNCYSNIKV